MAELPTLESHDLARATGGIGGGDTYLWSFPQAKLPKVGRGPIPVWRGVANLLIGAGKAAIFGTGITALGLEGIDALKANVDKKR